MLNFYSGSKAWKKITATVLLLCMLICSASAMLSALAEETDATYVVPDHLVDLVDPDKAGSSFERIRTFPFN